MAVRDFDKMVKKARRAIDELRPMLRLHEGFFSKRERRLLKSRANGRRIARMMRKERGEYER